MPQRSPARQATVAPAPPRHAAPPVPAGRPRRATQLRGRDPELQVIGEHLAAAAAGRGGVLLIDGPPGVGRTALLAEARAMAARAGVRPLLGQACASRQTVPFAPLLTATSGGEEPIVGAELARTLGAHAELRYWGLRELQDALAAAAARGPLAMLLDDLQWADTATLAALSAVPSLVAGRPILWILTRRTREGRAAVRHAMSRLERAGARRLRLGPISEEAAAAVVADRLGARPAPDVLALAASAHGNPFLLEELLRGLREEGRLRRDGDAVQLEGAGLPRRATLSMRERVERLSPEARHVVRMAAVLGPAFSVQRLASVLDRRPSTLVVALEEAEAADLLAETGDELGFRHDLVRQAVMGTMPRSVQRALQREAASVLTDAGAAPADVAALLADSAEAGDRAAIAALRQAARTLAGSDVAAAADLSVRALELAAEGDPDRGTAVAETVALLHAAARVDEARSMVQDALLGPPAPDQEAHVRLALSSMTLLAPLTRAAENRRALELTGLPPALRARHAAWLAFNLAAAAAAPDEARESARTAMAAAQAAGDLQARIMASLALVRIDGAHGRWLRALQRVEGLRRSARATRHEGSLLIADHVHAHVLGALGRVDEALAMVAAGTARARRQHSTGRLQEWARTAAALHLLAGRLEDARTENAGAGRPPADGGAGDLARMATRAQVAVHTGDIPLLRTLEAAARRVDDGESLAVRGHAAWILALAAMDRQDAAAAARWLTGAKLPSAPAMLPGGPGLEPLVARIAVAAGDRGLGRRALAAAEAVERENPGVPVMAGIARHTRGVVEDDADELLQAARILRGTQRPLLHAAAAEDAGRVLARQDRVGEAVAALLEALDAFTACGAAGDVRRVRRLLRAHGVRPRGPAQERPATGWASLTASELRVVRLVARGATNRDAAEQLFLSPHTVSSHLRHAFAKLDINSRIELTRVALTEEGAPATTQ